MTPADLRQRRDAAGLTQAQLAAVIGVTADTVARWEQGRRSIAPVTARLLALLLPPAPATPSP